MGAPGSRYFGHGASQIKVAGLPPQDLLIAALKRSHHMHVATLGAKPLVKRRVQFSYGGHVTFSVGGVDEHWRASIEAAREPLLRLGRHADCGWVAYATDFIDGQRRTWTGGRVLTRSEWDHNRHLWSSYVPEVFGIQVLTSAHLDRAKNLRDWQITPIGNGRCLVEAKDLEPWCSQATPWGSTRTFASSGFGNLILTETAVRADEHGWLEGNGVTRPTVL